MRSPGLLRSRSIVRVRATRLFVLAASALRLAACDQASNPLDRLRRNDRSAPAKHAVATGEVVGAEQQGPTVKWLTDANVLALLRLVNSRQVAASNVELERWHTGAVRDYAKDVRQDHLAMQRSIDSVAMSLKLAPIAPALAESLRLAGQSAVDRLSWRAAGSALEDAYMTDQVASHSWLVTFLQQLSAVAEAPELGGVIGTMGTRARAHLQRAQELLLAMATLDSLGPDSAMAIDSAVLGVPDTALPRPPARQPDSVLFKPPIHAPDTVLAKPPIRPNSTAAKLPKPPDTTAAAAGRPRRPPS
jgi:predicted outer membrane protein